ncbi:hypothetical protein LP421_11940 [Rhizobium sp. RCAM05350]|nr:hypothetical protein LP421_11940 [Rhizobium sp. RCAM05350]
MLFYRRLDGGPVCSDQIEDPLCRPVGKVESSEEEMLRAGLALLIVKSMLFSVEAKGADSLHVSKACFYASEHSRLLTGIIVQDQA